MAGWRHQLNGCELEQTPGDSEGQGSLVCCSPWGSQRIRHDWATQQQQNTIRLKYKPCTNFFKIMMKIQRKIYINKAGINLKLYKLKEKKLN